MSRKPNWALIGLGSMILVAGAVTPYPDDVATAPLGVALIAYGAGMV